MIPTPVLCRLCRRPIPRAAAKCPYCGARLSWVDVARAAEPRRAWPGWRIAAYVTGMALLVVVAVVWLSVLRDVKAPSSSVDDGAKPGGRPSAAECAELIAGLAKPSASEPVSSEIRTRFLQCFEKR